MDFELREEKKADLETERHENRRLKVTDEEVLAEFSSFNAQIHKVSLKSRYFAWYSLMILVIVGLGLVYITSFAHLYENSDVVTPFSEHTKQRMMFFFFWAGTYSDDRDASYAAGVYPYYILMLLLIAERLAQLWIEQRFGCDAALIRKFKQVEKQDQYYRKLALEKRK